jgi:hypothetical protein
MQEVAAEACTMLAVKELILEALGAVVLEKEMANLEIMALMNVAVAEAEGPIQTPTVVVVEMES